MRERISWAQSALEQGRDLAQARTVRSEWEDFYGRWHGKTAVPELEAGIESMHQLVTASLGATLERIFLTHLHEVLEARKDWLAVETLLKADVAFIEIMKAAPEAARVELRKIYRDHMKKEYDAETCYRDAEEDAAESEANHRKVLSALEADWPERVDAALRARLESLDGIAANAWQAEIAQRLAALSPAA